MHVCLYSVFSGEKGGEAETCREHPQQNGALEESDLWPKSEDLPFFSGCVEKGPFPAISVKQHAHKYATSVYQQSWLESHHIHSNPHL